MEQERAVNKVLRDMKQCDLIAKDLQGEVRSGEARFFLDLLFVAGMEHQKYIQGKNNNCQKKVEVFNRNNVKVNAFDSVADTAKGMGVLDTSISRLLANKKLSRKGYYFRYETNEDTDRSTTDKGGN